jgi:hypothetical protein
MTTRWCSRCGVHEVDDPRYSLCPVCADDVIREHNEARRELGWETG